MLEDVKQARSPLWLSPAEGAAPPPAWADRETRRVVRRQLWGPLVFFAVAALGVTGTVLIPVRGFLEEPWGLPVMVAVAGVAGGALAGGIAQLVLWFRLRAFLRGGPWFPAELSLRARRYATLTRGPHSVAVRLDRTTAGLGAGGDRIPVGVRSDGGPHLITVPPSRRILRALTSETDDRNEAGAGAA